MPNIAFVVERFLHPSVLENCLDYNCVWQQIVFTCDRGIITAIRFINEVLKLIVLYVRGMVEGIQKKTTLAHILLKLLWLSQCKQFHGHPDSHFCRPIKKVWKKIGSLIRYLPRPVPILEELQHAVVSSNLKVPRVYRLLFFLGVSIANNIAIKKVLIYSQLFTRMEK